jgi:hypothetical protein
MPTLSLQEWRAVIRARFPGTEWSVHNMEGCVEQIAEFCGQGVGWWLNPNTYEISSESADSLRAYSTYRDYSEGDA